MVTSKLPSNIMEQSHKSRLGCLALQCCIAVCLLCGSNGLENPEAEMSRAELLDEIGVRQEARSAQQANGLDADETQCKILVSQ